MVTGIEVAATNPGHIRVRIKPRAVQYARPVSCGGESYTSGEGAREGVERGSRRIAAFVYHDTVLTARIRCPAPTASGVCV